jgi:type IV secretion system protein VirB5
MRINRSAIALITSAGLLSLSPSANAQWAVIDVASIKQLAMEVTTLEQQLSTAQNALSQAQAQYQSLTGGRGMQNLLSGITYNYLPADWSSLVSAINQTSTSYSALSSNIQSNLNANAVLSSRQVATLSPAEASQLQAARLSAATLQALTQQALSTTSSRFASIQQLITAIGSATDAKGALDLQARIQSEQGLLQTEGTKLGVLYQVVQAEELTRKQQARENAIAGIGSLRTLSPLRLP